MEIEILVVEGCANEEPARVLAERALARAGIEAPIVVTVISDDQQARARGFTGSPTILIDGIDPFADPSGQVGLACRLYSAGGTPSGTPSVEDMEAALLQARDSLRS